MAYNLGDLIVFSVLFLDSAGADVDPTLVRFYLREELDGTELEWVFNAVPTEGTHYPTGQNPVVKDSTGDYHVNYFARKAERVSAYYKAVGGSAVTTVQGIRTAFVRHAGIALVEP